MAEALASACTCQVPAAVRFDLTPHASPWRRTALRSGWLPRSSLVAGRSSRPRRRRAWSGPARATRSGWPTLLDEAPDLRLGAAALRRHRGLRAPDRRRPPVDLRQGRVRRAGGRAGGRPWHWPGCAASATYARAERWEAPSGGTCSAAGSRSSAAAASPSRCCGSCSPSTATSPWCATGCSRWTAPTRCWRPTATRTHCPGADVVFLALALTPETEGIISAGELSLMERHAWLVNVARGAPRRHRRPGRGLALGHHRRGRARRDGSRAAARPATRCGRCRTASSRPHVGNTPDMAEPLLAERITSERPPLRRR